MADTPVESMVQTLNRAYGPYAFGVISLLAVWWIILKPALADSRTDTKALTAITTSLEVTARTIDSAAQLLDRTAQRMERVADKINGGR